MNKVIFDKVKQNKHVQRVLKVGVGYLALELVIAIGSVVWIAQYTG